MPAQGVHEFAAYSEAFSLGLSEVYEDRLKQHERSYTAFLKEETAKRWFDTDWSVSGLGATPEKAIGAAFSTDKRLKSATKQYALTAYALGTLIEYEAMRWEIYGIFDGLPQELADSATDRYNIVGHSILNNSFSAPSSAYQIYNGENMLSTAHVRLDGGTWSNKSTDNVGLSYLGIQQGKTDLAKTVNERGRFVKLQAKQLIVSEDQRWIAETIMGSIYRPDNANMNKNTVKGEFSIYASPYLTNANYWWLQSNKGDIRIKMRLGDKPKLKRDQDIRNWTMVMVSYCSFGVAVFDSKGLWGSTGGG